VFKRINCAFSTHTNSKNAANPLLHPTTIVVPADVLHPLVGAPHRLPEPGVLNFLLPHPGVRKSSVFFEKKIHKASLSSRNDRKGKVGFIKK